MDIGFDLPPVAFANESPFLHNDNHTSRWDTYFMGMANHVATMSKDESTKLGCVIVGPSREVRSTGYNSFPRGINDNVAERQERPLKYKFFEHAERNAIYNAARIGVSTLGCILYVAWHPCSDCARAIIQAGIKEVVLRSLEVPERWAEDNASASKMLKEAGVIVRTMREVSHD